MRSTEQHHMITQALSSASSVFKPGTQATHPPCTPAKGGAHLWRADADMTIQQVMAHLDILNRVLEQTLKEEKIQMI